MSRFYVQAHKFQLAGSGCSSSATSINLVSFKITKADGSTRDITMADFGDLGLMVIDPGIPRKEETITFTGVTQNGDGSATLTGVTRGVTPFTPYGSDSAYASSHSGFVTAILSNPAKMYSNFIGPTDNVTVTGLWTFPYPTAAYQPAVKQYVDDVLAGAIGTATDIQAGSVKVTKDQSTKPRAKSTYVREQNTPDMTLKVESFRNVFIDKIVNFTGGNSPAFINPGFGGDLAIVANPSNGETVTLTINGTVCVFTFVTSLGAAPGNILIQGTAALTRAALATFIANPGTTNANQVAFAGAQLTALGLISSTDDLSANLFIRAASSTVTTFSGAETMAGGSNTWTANTTKNRIDLLVLNDAGSLAIRQGSEAVSPAAPTPTNKDLVLCSVYNIPGETTIMDRPAALTGYISEWYDLTTYRNDIPPVGVITPFAGSSAPTGWLLCDGSAVSRTTYSTLFAIISTTYGVGDGSTTFNLPNLRSRSVIGVGAGTKVATFASRSSNVITVTGLTNAANNEFQTGQAVTYVTSGSVITGLTSSTVYYIVRITNTTFSLATTLANAIAGTVIALSSDGSGTQTFTQTLTTRTLGDTGGEENHALILDEVPGTLLKTAGTIMDRGLNSPTVPTTANNSPGDKAHNIMNPFIALNYIIKT